MKPKPVASAAALKALDIAFSDNDESAAEAAARAEERRLFEFGNAPDEFYDLP
jgi:hypothetical protein